MHVLRLLVTLALCTLVLQLAPVTAQHQQLLTPWAADVDPENVLPEYPRPQLVRADWFNLNGWWDYALTRMNDPAPTEFEGQILVPFPIESYLSSVQRRADFKHIWYQRTFTVPESWTGARVLLHFGAVDWRVTAWVNGIEIGSHIGGYDAFTFDITDALRPSGEQHILLDVFDPTEGTQPRGKQVFRPDGIWYTPSSGIWQTVWLEPVPSVAIDALHMETDIDAGVLHLSADLSSATDVSGYTLEVDARASDELVSTASGAADATIEVVIPDPQLWSPDSPFLYDLDVRLVHAGAVVDQVGSYFGLRKIAVAPDAEGVLRLWLNNAPLFQFGLLDQGFWPDGLYTAPTDEALRHDIEVTRQLGFNTIRKHVKVEPERWYYWADRLGVLVWQDMPSGDAFVDPGQGEIDRSDASAAQFELELQRMVDTHANHPSIVMWVIFNEGWGQYDTVRLAEWLQAYDPTRLVNSASGWNDVGAGDVYDIHSYRWPDVPGFDSQRARILGEFGGLGLPLSGHTYLAQNSWGYRQYATVADLTVAYTDLIEQLHTLYTDHGLAAAIYTQTTDVETEVNGMLTYDRAVIKMDVDQLYALNSTFYQALTASN
ncbi:MAG: beta-galactosidase [Anaerolineae bacterium]|nr:beta-galactosidase [Anaerolineae bacterium]